MKKQKKPAPPKPVTKRGLDYTPQRPHSPALSYGVAERIKASYTNTAHEIVARRLENFEACRLPVLEGAPTCPRHDILLPWHAPDHCATYKGICDHFERQALPHQQHLIGILTLRFQHHDCRHRLWERGRAFLMERIVAARELPVVVALHIPSRALRSTGPHLHAMIFLRRLLGPDFADFDRDLIGPAAKQILALEWSNWPA